MNKRRFALVFFSVVFLGLAGCRVQNSHSAPVTKETLATARDRTLSSVQETLEQIYTDAKPSVVNIKVVQKQEVVFPTVPEIPGFPFFGPELPQGPQEEYRSGLGSGFVWDSRGYIVTNNHVVDGADKISVTFHDGTTVTGKVVGTDPDSDLALVKVNVAAKLLKPVEIADSTKVKVGQLTVAIGNPFGLESTMTVGFVSGLGRLLPADSGNLQGPSYSIPDIIQTDAPINPGNSGGVLLDDQGRLIGVTAAILSPVGASIGIGFAIPSVIVQKVIPALIATGHYEHTWLGLSGTSLTPELDGAMKIKTDQRGALIVDVVPGSPADKAGLRGSDRQVTMEGQQVRVGGDIIVAIDGNAVKKFDDVVTYLVRSTKVGQTIEVTVLRGEKAQPITVALAARPKSKAQTELTKSEAWLGVSGITVTPELAKAIGLAPKREGVLIEQVEQNSPADKAGLRGSYKPLNLAGEMLLVGGDIILAFDGKPIRTVQDLQAQVGESRPARKVRLTVQREDKTVELTATLEKRPALS